MCRATEEAMTLAARETDTPRVAASTVDVVTTGSALGAEVRGVDLKHLDDAAFAGLIQAWHDHSVLLLRGQSLSDQDLIALLPSSRRGLKAPAGGKASAVFVS